MSSPLPPAFPPALLLATRALPAGSGAFGTVYKVLLGATPWPQPRSCTGAAGGTSKWSLCRYGGRAGGEAGLFAARRMRRRVVVRQG